jgi:hypothetical protein
MGKITASVLATLFAVGMSGAAMAQESTPSRSMPSSTPSNSANPSGGMAAANDVGSGNGSAVQSQISTSKEVRSKLEASGYTSVSGIHKSSDGFTAMAKKDGKSVHVAIDQQGKIETR